MKIIHHTLFLLSITFIFGGCQAYNAPGYYTRVIKRSGNQKMYSIAYAANLVQKRYPLSFSAIEDPENEMLLFETSHLLTVDEAREMIVDIADTFLKVFNQHKDHNPDIQYYPFYREDLRIAIVIKEDETSHENPVLGFVILCNGAIQYCAQHPENPRRYQYIDESLEEALQKVKAKYKKDSITQNEYEGVT